ncbi:hypothetical protein EE612_029498 [Oryza sativa]|nr:hypothetical protein EE612_029498 [Oryza sativa]
MMFSLQNSLVAFIRSLSFIFETGFSNIETLMVLVPLILFAHLFSSSSFGFLAGNFRRQKNTIITPIMITTTTPTTAPMIAALFLLFAEAWQPSNGSPQRP